MKNYKTFLFVLLLCSIAQINAKTILKTKWSKTFGGSKYDGTNGIIKAHDSGYLILGTSKSNDGDKDSSKGDYDIWLLKIDENGKELWNKTYGGSKEDFGKCIIKTKDNGYLIAAHTGSDDGDIDSENESRSCLIMKFNYKDEVEWKKLFTGVFYVTPRSIIQIDDGGFVIGGYIWPKRQGTLEDAWIMKINNKGEMEWEATFGDTFRNYVFDVVQTQDKGYLMVGKTYLYKDVIVDDSLVNKIILDALIIKVDSDGKLLWKKTFGGSGFETANIVKITKKSDIYVFGTTTSFNGDVGNPGHHGRVWAFKLNSSGELLWSKKYDGYVPSSVIQNKNDDFILLKTVYGNKAIYDMGLMKIDSAGKILWSKDYGGSDYEYSSSVIKSNDDLGFILAGYSKSKDGDIPKNQGNHDYWILNVDVETIIDSCLYNFTYKLPQDSINLNLKNNAKFIDNTIQLTNKEMGRKGSAWFKNKVGIKNGFITEFLFKFTDGNNYKIIDGSLPGADGIAFVIQGNDSTHTGGIGGNIGYGGIPNSLAIEIDTYKNFLKGFEDPNGNHLAVFCNGTDINNADHKSKALLGETSDIPIIQQDSIYRCKILYKDKQLFIFLNKENEEENLVLSIDVDIASKIILNDYFEAFVGLTASTGNSVETHNILSWEFCSAETEFNISNYQKINKSNLVYPNPNDGKFYINLENIDSPVREIYIFNPQGKIEYHNKLQNHLKKELKIDLKLNPSSYFIKIIAEDNDYYAKFIIN